MTMVVGMLAIGDTGLRGGFVASRPTLVGSASDGNAIFRTQAPLDGGRWQAIVIHHLGQPAGDPNSITRLHVEDHGYQSLGYHFILGNGRGMGDGDLYMGERWLLQQPGAHATGPDEAWHNQHSIGICLVGNGNRRAFTGEQISTMTGLVRMLQRELGIPADRVYLHRDIADVSSPGQFFPVARLEEQLLDRPR